MHPHISEEKRLRQSHCPQGKIGACHPGKLDLCSARFREYAVPPNWFAALAQLVRALDCGSRGPRFDPERWYHPKPPHLLKFCRWVGTFPLASRIAADGGGHDGADAGVIVLILERSFEAMHQHPQHL
jgi:hypothetical protein